MTGSVPILTEGDSPILTEGDSPASPSAPIPYLTSPAVIVNQALDLLGSSEDAIIGDINDGTRVAEAARRVYSRLLREMLRANHWGFARKETELQLLGDATGNSEAPVISQVPQPWLFAYAWPTDAVQGRWLMWNPVASQPTNGDGTQLTTGSSAVVPYNLVPGRFLITSTDLYPIEIGVVDWDQQPDLQRTQGLEPTYRQVILSNCESAHFVYTRFAPVIEGWDPGFRMAMAASLGWYLCEVALDDPKERARQKAQMTGIVKEVLTEARVQANNEAGFPQSVDTTPPWITARNYGNGWGALGNVGVGPSMTLYGGDGFGMGASSFYLGGSVF